MKSSECERGPADSCRPLDLRIKPLKDRKIILLATATIHNDSLFVNGLFQNVFILYKLFDSLGYAPILLVNEKPKDISKVPPILRSVRMTTADEIIRTSIPIHLLLEIAMSIEPGVRNILRKLGTKVVKLYLGNILNIDIETPIFYPRVHFSHHIVGELDEFWFSPHYKQHYEYAGILNHCKPAKIAPYVWDPSILTLGGTRMYKWRPRLPGESQMLVILEPNISFQKCSLVPLMIIERYYKMCKGDIKVLLGNSEKFQGNPFFMKSILPNLELYKDKKIILSGRHTITSILTEYPSAFALAHHWNNEYNYMTLEYLLAGFPIIHNASDWSDAGYFYSGSDISEGAGVLKRALEDHSSSLERYQAQASALHWRHSPYNPAVQEAWLRLLEA